METVKKLYVYIFRTLPNNVISKLRNEKTQKERSKPWFEINGDKTLRLDYPLNESSVVVDVGGYEGQWASDIFSRYCCDIIIFEPVKNYYNRIKERFLKNKKICCYNVGLSNIDDRLSIALLDDGSSLFKKNKATEEINIVNASNFLHKNGITHIDLMKINIEGSEYDLLENLLSSGYTSKIYNIQIQFHDFVPNARKKMRTICAELAKTHQLTYKYEFVWENWQIKK